MRRANFPFDGDAVRAFSVCTVGPDARARALASVPEPALPPTSDMTESERTKRLLYEGVPIPSAFAVMATTLTATLTKIIEAQEATELHLQALEYKTGKQMQCWQTAVEPLVGVSVCD